MRTTRIAAVTVLAGLVAWFPAPAGANGGAYLAFDETYYVPGSPASGETYVFVPDANASLLDRGPFWLYALPDGVSLAEGRPLPASAVQLGQLTIEQDGKENYELSARFTIPELAPGDYTVGVCNAGCELTGFGEELSGFFVVAATAREVDLLRRNDVLAGDVANLEHRLKKAERAMAAIEDELALSEGGRDDAVADADGLRERLEAAEVRTASLDATLASTSTSLSRWRLVALLLAALAIVAFAVSMMLAARRRRGVGVAMAGTVEA